MPVLRAPPSPRFCSWRITRAPCSRATSPVASAEQSSTTITSAGGRGAWAKALATARPIMVSRL
jgi:hypothetical protein